MPLFIVRHQHAPERCPAGDPFQGAMLLNHLSRPNVRKHGISILAEAVARNEHSLYMIVECDSEDKLGDFLSPFSMAGSVDIYPAATCAGVVSSGGCGLPLPAGSDLVEACDPEVACQQAIDDGLVVHRAHPLNCETSLPELVGGIAMPTSRFYIRNHFQIPRLSSDQWRLKIDGLVDEPLHLSLQDLIAMPSEVTQVTLECAGNGRSALEPRVAGEQWNFGAVSTAEWTGVPVLEVLKRAGVREDARYIVFRGADQGTVDETSGPIFFERALSIEEARESNAMLAYVMNGEPLPPKHGYPVRVIVPSWYAVASVKWLAEITLTSEPLQAHYQTETYYFERESNGTITREPVSFQRVRSLTTEPAEGAELRPGPLSVRGVAWSGVAPIARVEVSLNGGEWAEARLLGEPERHRWQRWEWTTSVDEPGPHQVRSRAFDEAGRIQPDVPEWNRLGYGNNAILPVNFRITA